MTHVIWFVVLLWGAACLLTVVMFALLSVAAFVVPVAIAGVFVVALGVGLSRRAR